MSRLARSAAVAAVAVLVLLAGLAPGTRASAAHPDWDEWDFLNLVNRERRGAGLPPLAMAPGVRDVARAWSGVMADRGSLGHNPSFRDQLAARYPEWRRVGENVGRGGGVAELHRAFMESPGHRANVLGDYGFAAAGVVWRGSTLWVTVNFLKHATPVPAATRAPVARLEGLTDSDTSVAVSRRRGAGSAAAVVVARADDFADALAGGPLASVHAGPVLLVPRDHAPGAVVAEARRVLAPGGRVLVLGGPAALSPAVEAAFAGLVVERIAGADRYATAVAVAPRVNARPGTVFVASGTSFADAVVAGAPAGARRAPVLLVAPGTVPEATAAYLRALPSGVGRVVVGGSAVVSDAVGRLLGLTSRLAGADRYATSVAVADAMYSGASRVTVVSGARFADALVAAPEAARIGSPVVLTAPSPDDDTYGYVGAQASRWSEGVVVGRSDAVPPATVTLLFT